ncbi:hypothetical protein GNZ12_24100 [Paraburkholderia sp. 1N]|uniref:WD40 repeat protein n=1 Tax=Paraburkholderia solitsugae TaxID=2675748 RepID=A0ABX2BW89_9BURK|nr:PD40 domain-containing protein [Paraburkholderia solitsugae]NPT44336.1 hypothetical protein [Paraburkholderia solitsugae]
MKKTILAALLALAAASAHAQSVGVQWGNIVYASATGERTVLTDTGADASPVLSPDGRLVAFTRLRQGEQAGSDDPQSGPLADVYVMRLADHHVTKIVSAAHSNDPTAELSGIRSLTFSVDGATLYFETPAWAVAGAIHAVPLHGGQRFVTDGNGFAVVSHGKYVGDLVVKKHRYMAGRGSWNPEVIVSAAGKDVRVLGEFGDDEYAVGRALRNVEAQQ